MKLESFQIINCFGFRDSRAVNLSDANNFIYVLGRNSSGKSSFLNAIKYFEVDIIPKDQSNFENFNDSGQEPILRAEFSITEKDLSHQSFIESFDEKYKKLGFSAGAISLNPKLEVLRDNIYEIYEGLINELRASGKAIIQKTAKGNFHFVQKSPFEKYNSRMEEVKDALNSAREVGGGFNISGTVQDIDISFNTIENIMFQQFPQIFLFNEEYSLRDSLPERIDDETIRTTDNKLLTAFISFLDEDTVNNFLESNDPDERDELRTRLQQSVSQLTDKVNKAANRNQDLLEIRLHEKNGLQITVITDGKKSYYSHLSENTKFLFAYYLYHERENISGNILLFDEPSNGFHPTAQEFILNFLKSLADSQNLVIVSTHSEHMIDLNLLSGVRLMSIDDKKNIIVKNHIYNQPTGKGDYLALQPIFDAIGYSYGRQINVKDKVSITEGITDMLYLRAFNTILKHKGELNIAPSRGDSNILSLIPFLISQGITFKIVLDTSNIKQLIKAAYDIDDKFIYEVQIPPEFVGKMSGSGIEDLFTKDDFKKLLMKMGDSIEANYKRVSNSSYMKNRVTKRLLAHHLYENANNFSGGDFDAKTVDNFREVLDFCKRDSWFDI